MASNHDKSSPGLRSAFVSGLVSRNLEATDSRSTAKSSPTPRGILRKQTLKNRSNVPKSQQSQKGLHVVTNLNISSTDSPDREASANSHEDEFSTSSDSESQYLSQPQSRSFLDLINDGHSTLAVNLPKHSVFREVFNPSNISFDSQDSLNIPSRTHNNSNSIDTIKPDNNDDDVDKPNVNPISTLKSDASQLFIIYSKNQNQNQNLHSSSKIGRSLSLGRRRLHHEIFKGHTRTTTRDEQFAMGSHNTAVDNKSGVDLRRHHSDSSTYYDMLRKKKQLHRQSPTFTNITPQNESMFHFPEINMKYKSALKHASLAESNFSRSGTTSQKSIKSEPSPNLDIPLRNFPKFRITRNHHSVLANYGTRNDLYNRAYIPSDLPENHTSFQRQSWQTELTSIRTSITRSTSTSTAQNNFTTSTAGQSINNLDRFSSLHKDINLQTSVSNTETDGDALMVKKSILKKDHKLIKNKPSLDSALSSFVHFKMVKENNPQMPSHSNNNIESLPSQQQESQKGKHEEEIKPVPSSFGSSAHTDDFSAAGTSETPITEFSMPDIDNRLPKDSYIPAENGKLKAETPIRPRRKFTFLKKSPTAPNLNKSPHQYQLYYNKFKNLFRRGNHIDITSGTGYYPERTPSKSRRVKTHKNSTIRNF